MKRYFSFGCSYTSHSWATVVDFIGVNFDKFVNLGGSGSSNSFMVDQLLKAHEAYNLTPDDFVTVGTTGIGRYSFYSKQENSWSHSGDIFPKIQSGHPSLSKLWSTEFESHYFSIYRSATAIKNIKLILDLLKVPYIIYGAVNNLEFKSVPDEQSQILLNEFYRLHDIPETIDEFTVRTIENNEKFGYEFDSGEIDRHPSQQQHYKYFKNYFREYDNEKTKIFYDIVENNLQKSSIKDQQNRWYTLRIRPTNLT